jgi:hypothetical protein
LEARYFARSREIIDWMLDYGVDINRTDYRRTDEGERLAGPNDTSLKVLNGVAARGDIGLYDHLIVRGADQSRSLALHCASRCKDTEKSTAMIDHLLDRYHMDIEFDNEVLRNHFDTVGDSGTPLESAVYHQNLPAVHKLLARGAQPRPAMAGAIGHYKFMEGYLPALCPLLDAGLDLGEAFNWAVLWGNVDAAKICLERGADPTDALKKQRAREARLDAERNSSTEMVNQNSEDERLPRGEISPEMEDFLRSIRTRESFCE